MKLIKYILIPVLIIISSCSNPTQVEIEVEEPRCLLKTHSFYDDILYVTRYYDNNNIGLSMPSIKDTIIGDHCGILLTGPITLSSQRDFDRLCYLRDNPFSGAVEIKSELFFFFGYDNCQIYEEEFDCPKITYDTTYTKELIGQIGPDSVYTYDMVVFIDTITIDTSYSDTVIKFTSNEWVWCYALLPCEDF